MNEWSGVNEISVKLVNLVIRSHEISNLQLFIFLMSFEFYTVVAVITNGIKTVMSSKNEAIWLQGEVQFIGTVTTEVLSRDHLEGIRYVFLYYNYHVNYV